MTSETKDTTVVDAMTIAREPETFGFSWEYRDLNKGRDQKTLLRSHVPHFTVSEAQFDTFLKTFPKAVMAAINGTSVVIRGQNVARPFIRSNGKATDIEIAAHMVRSVLLNVVTRSVGTRTMYVGADGKSYATLGEAQAASSGATVAAVDVVTLAQQFLADAVDMGVPLDKAREKAREKWPDAFVEEDSSDEDEDEDDATDEEVVENGKALGA